MKYAFTCILLGIIINSVVIIPQTLGGDMAIENGRKVSFDYTLNVDGEELDSSKDRGPLEYTHGDDSIIKGLSRQIEGLHAGEEKDVVVLPEEGYGKVDPSALMEVSKSQLPVDVDLKVGLQLQVKSPQGDVIVKVREVKEQTVIVDFNHPLAGKTLNFHVKINTIE